MEDSDHLPVRERLKNLASTSGAAGRLVKCKRDMEDAGKERIFTDPGKKNKRDLFWSLG
jgi:hypothetical protein